VQILDLYPTGPNRLLRWRDYKGPIISLLFQGTHWFALYEGGTASNPRTLFSHGAAMSGPGLPWLVRSMNATRWRFEKFNKALKKEVEAQVLRVSAGTLSGHCIALQPTLGHIVPYNAVHLGAGVLLMTASCTDSAVAQFAFSGCEAAGRANDRSAINVVTMLNTAQPEAQQAAS
jgi:hypothetical protein